MHLVDIYKYLLKSCSALSSIYDMLGCSRKLSALVYLHITTKLILIVIS